jgi:uncharacterized protein
MKKTLQDHLDPNSGPKRILSLDGGGIRGALTLGYLKRIESILQEKYGKNYLLCDHFDLIGGTSTGSIIAAGLAMGKTVEEIRELYMQLGGKIFGKKRRWYNPFEFRAFLKAEYDYSALEASLQEVFRYKQEGSGQYLQMNLGSDQLKTGLTIVAKRADTNSTWPMINHPGGKYFEYNKNIPLWQAIRASSAAPTYFEPKLIDVGKGQKAAFIDGGVSMANNPSLTLLMVATLQGFPFRWKTGEDNLTMVSVGTGHTVFRRQTGDITKAWLKTWAKNVPEMLMQDASKQNQLVMQWLSKSPTAIEIDSEIGSLEMDSLGASPVFKYLRYSMPITENHLNGLQMGRSFNANDVDDLAEMSHAYNKEILYDLGAADAARTVLAAHFD